VRAGRGVGGRRPGRTRPRLRSTPPPERDGEPDGNGHDAGGGARGGRHYAAADLFGRGAEVLVGAGDNSVRDRLPASEGRQIPPRPRAPDSPAGAAGEG